jgi:hypothetical protein
MRKLNSVFDQTHNRFQTSLIKGTIDLCDLILMQLYHIPQDLYNYILNFESTIRQGRQLSKTLESQFISILQKRVKPSSPEIRKFKDLLTLIDK